MKKAAALVLVHLLILGFAIAATQKWQQSIRAYVAAIARP